MGTPYKEAFPAGAIVKVVSKTMLEVFALNWKFHHQLQTEQMKFAGIQATVKNVSFYHGGDQLYVLEGVPGIWHEACLESAQ